MIKVTRTDNETTGVTGFVFECNTADDLQTLDMMRVAFLNNDVPKRGNYSNSNTLVIETKIPKTTLS
jgi:hypothetical protein